MLFTRMQLQEIQDKIGVVFRDPRLLDQAFVHRSYLNETRRNDLQHNERLEFLGDAVLELALSHHLFVKLPDAPEGKMTPIRSALVSAKMLSFIATELELQKYLFLSKGERKALEAGERSGPIILANTFEALLGAIFLDRGLGVAEIFLDSCLFPKLKEIVAKRMYLDPKSCLQDLAQTRWKATPAYQVTKEEGPAHGKQFDVAVYVDERCLGQGTGASKALAEVAAARDALQKEFQVVLAEF